MDPSRALRNMAKPAKAAEAKAKRLVKSVTRAPGKATKKAERFVKKVTRVPTVAKAAASAVRHGAQPVKTAAEEKTESQGNEGAAVDEGADVEDPQTRSTASASASADPSRALRNLTKPAKAAEAKAKRLVKNVTRAPAKATKSAERLVKRVTRAPGKATKKAERFVKKATRAPTVAKAAASAVRHGAQPGMTAAEKTESQGNEDVDVKNGAWCENVHHGWIDKFGGKFKREFQLRFLVLKGTQLAYFKSVDDQEPRGVIDIGTAQFRFFTVDPGQSVRVKSKGDNIILVQDGWFVRVTREVLKTHVIRFPSEDGFIAWRTVIEALNENESKEEDDETVFEVVDAKEGEGVADVSADVDEVEEENDGV